MNYGYNCRHANDLTSTRQVELNYFWLKGYISWPEYQWLGKRWTFRKFMKALGFTFKRQPRARQ